MKPSALVTEPATAPTAVPAHRPDASPRGRLQPQAEAAEALEAIASSALLRGRKSVRIEHNGALYQLRATKFGKLILTK